MEVGNFQLKCLNMKRIRDLTIGQRLEMLRKNASMSRDVVVRQTTISKSTLQAWELDQREPSIAGAIELAKLYDVNPKWVVFGDESEKQALSVNNTTLSDSVAVFQYDLTASAGGGSYVVSENAIASFHFKKQWLAEQGLHNKRLSVVEIKGDSMERTLFHGDLTLVSLLDFPQEAREGVCVLRYDDEILVKRIQYDFRSRSYEVSSDNQQYKAFTVSQDEVASGSFSVVARVERVIQRLNLHV